MTPVTCQVPWVLCTFHPSHLKSPFLAGGCRQEEPHCASVSFDRHAANAFQTYVSSALAFSIKRGGILYGNKDEEGNTTVHAIFEPSQVQH